MNDKIEEEVKVTVEEVPEQMEDRVKELAYTLNTMDSSQATQVTDMINGELKCIIVKSDKPVSIDINLSEYSEIKLLSIRNYQGVQYFPLKTDSIASTGERFNFAPSRWYLNNRLSLNVNDNSNTEVTFIIRYC